MKICNPRTRTTRARGPLARGILLALCFGVAIVTALAASNSAWKSLLQGKDLSNWEVLLGRAHLSDTIPGLARNPDGTYLEQIGLGRDPTGVFTLLAEPEGPVIRVSGRVFGALITKESFSNYHLRLQFKWGDAKWAPRAADNRDSGILYHIEQAVTDGRRSVPRSLEFRIREGGTGDVYAIGLQAEVRARLRGKEAPIYDPAAEPVKLGPGSQPNRPFAAPLADCEKPRGEWNDLELFCVGAESVYIVNGHVVMRVANPLKPVGDGYAPIYGGRIGLQSEGAEVYFRKMEVRLLAAIPSDLGEKVTVSSPWEMMAENLTSADAPCADVRGNFYFCDMRATPPVIWCVDIAGRSEKVFEGLACSGLEFDAQGRLFACAFTDGQLVEIDLANRTKRVVVPALKPNDLALAPNQRAYVTETGKKQVTFVDLSSGAVRSVNQGLVNAPNGIALSSGGGELLVSDFKGESIWRFGILPDGGLAEGRPFAAMQLPPEAATAGVSASRVAKGDGMVVDASGRVYVATAIGVQVFDQGGTLLTVLPKPTERGITSCTVAGPASEYLYITAGDRVFRTRLAAAPGR